MFSFFGKSEGGKETPKKPSDSLLQPGQKWVLDPVRGWQIVGTPTPQPKKKTYGKWRQGQIPPE